MISALARRLAQSVFLIFGVSVLTFLMIDAAPGQYLEEMKLNPQISPQTLAALRAQYGLDRPLAVRYGLWLRSAARGEFGFSFAYNCPVWPLLRERAANTLLLTVTAALIAWTMAIPIGILVAARAGRWQDQVAAVSTTFLLGAPDVLIGLVLLRFALNTRWFPTGGMRTLASTEMGLAAGAEDLARHLFLPVAAHGGNASHAGSACSLRRAGGVELTLRRSGSRPWHFSGEDIVSPRTACVGQSPDFAVRHFLRSLAERVAPDRSDHELAGRRSHAARGGSGAGSVYRGRCHHVFNAVSCNGQSNGRRCSLYGGSPNS